MRIMVIHSNRRGDFPALDLIKTARSMGLDAKLIVVKGINITIGDSLEIKYLNESLLEYDGGIIRSIGFNISIYQLFRRIAIFKALEDMGVTLMNPVDSLLISRNKLLTLVKLRKAGINIPKTFASELLKEEYEVAAKLGTSVIKPVLGSRGYGISLLSDPDVAFNVLKTLALYKQYPLIQEYLKGKGYDIRVFVVNGRAIAAMKRVATSSWKTNIAQGGKGEPIELDEEIESLAIKATSAIGLWYAGVDIMESNGRYYVLEVNGSPDWRELKAVTKTEPAKEILKCLIEKIKR
ncbi:MAG: RimK family alpha-L-glutamate ligase [Thermoprotei archaeon]|nr:MAG: RimK family alpha-L-glutamate ligase [Thermoprotei archaeon]RLF19048.1 MAG: RimK family alpha-L-glutamate ligase [Thermoprotei archaeon]